MASVAL